MILDIVKVFVPFALTFSVGIAISAVLTKYLYKYKMWKKKSGKLDMTGGETPIFNNLHKDKEVGTPKMGGVIIWLSCFIVIVGLWLLSKFFAGGIFEKLDFLSRDQTWIPLFTLLGGGIVGLLDDFLEIKGNGSHISGGLSLKKRLSVVATLGLVGALWFYLKLDVISIGLPNFLNIEEINLGILFIPFFVIVVIALYSGGVIDGLDGLAGGIFAIMFSAYGAIAFAQNQINLAAFSAMLAGGILAFLWFNIPPARYYMSETGTMGLTVTLAIVAFMTDRLGEGHGVFVLPIIAFPLLATSLSDIIQVISKKYRGGKKVFQVAPIHHHFEAIGWPASKITMRYWVISIVFAIIGIILALL